MNRGNINRRQILKYAGAAGLLAMSQAGQAQSGGPLDAVWVHGTAFTAEDEGALKGTVRRGWGTEFHGKPGIFTWFHISIATPVLINDVRPALEKVFVFYKTDGAQVRNVHVYDGPRKVKAFDGLAFSGDFSGGISGATSWAVDPRLTIYYGLGLSIGVQFSVGFDSPVPTQILFTTAGADFRLVENRRIIDTPRNMQSPVLRRP